jgi:predicted aldo/keto reductase-like oxidoreductase
MKRRAFLGSALVGLPITGAFAAQPKPKAVDIPTTKLGKAGIEVQIIAQGGARMDLHPDIPSAAKHVREVYDLGLRYFDCARMYWNGQSEEAYGIGLQGVRQHVFLTSKSAGRTAKDAEKDLETSLRLLKTDHLDLWQMHNIMTLDDVQAVMKPGGAMEAFEAAKKAGKCRLIGFTGHFDPEAHVAMLKAYDTWDTVMMPVHAADHAYLSFEQIALPVAVARGVPNQAIKVFGKANLLRSLPSSTCLRYALSQPGTPIAICGCGSVGQMADNIRAVQDFRKMTPEESADVRKRAVVGAGVFTGSTLEYWKKRA